MISIIEFIDADDTSLKAFAKGGLAGLIKRDAEIVNRNSKKAALAIGGGLGSALVGYKILKKKKESQ